MKHRRKNKTKIKVNRKDRIQSADNLKFDASCNLVTEVLIDTYKTYKTSLLYWTKNRDKYLKIYKHIGDYEEYKKLRDKYNNYKKMKKPKPYHIEFMEHFITIEKVSKPSPSDYGFYWKYISNRQELDACVWFYHSARYKAFCLNNYVDGDVVMARARKEIGL